jgi:hypothetical protein
MQPALYRPRLFSSSFVLVLPRWRSQAYSFMLLQDTPRRHYLSYYTYHLHCTQIFREDRTVSTPKRAKHCVSARLYTDSRRAAVDAMNGAEALGRATVLRKDSSDGE